MERKSEFGVSQVQRYLLNCGIISPAMYVLADVIAGMSWAEYSFRDYTISELGAVGAPTATLFSIMLIVVYLVFLAFGVAVWKEGSARKGIRLAGGFLIAIALLALMVGQFVPMMPRGTAQGVSGALHLIEGAIAMTLVFSAMLSASISLQRWFRIYTVTTICIVLAFGAWSGFDAPKLEAGLDTPWLGVKERVFWYSYQLWFAMFAMVLLRKQSLRIKRDSPVANV